MNTPDKNMLQLIEYLIYKKVYTSYRNFCIENKILEQTISKIKKGQNHFTVSQIESVCIKHKVNFNWIFGIENEMFNSEQKVNKN